MKTVASRTGKTSTSHMAVKNMITIGMLSAIAVILMLFEFPIPFLAPGFYKLDLSELPVLIGTFAMGPLAGVAIEFVKIVLNLLINGTTTAYVGELGNFIVGCAFLIPAGVIYWKKKTFRRAVIGLVSGGLTMVVAGSLMNAYVLLPLYAVAFGGMQNIIAAGTAVNSHISSVGTFVMLAVAPFNLVKAVLVSVLTLLLYKRISILLKKF